MDTGPYKQKKLLKKNQGMALFTMLIFGLAFFFSLIIVLQGVNSYRQNFKRFQTYLCAKRIEGETRNYLKTMTKLNKKIRVAYYASMIPKIGRFSAIAMKGLILLQEFKHLEYIKNMSQMRGCQKVAKLACLSLNPFQGLSFKLKRQMDKTAILKKKKYQCFVSNLYRSDLFVLKIEFKLKNNRIFKWSRTKEISNGGSLF